MTNLDIVFVLFFYKHQRCFFINYEIYKDKKKVVVVNKKRNSIDYYTNPTDREISYLKKGIQTLADIADNS